MGMSINNIRLNKKTVGFGVLGILWLLAFGWGLWGVWVRIFFGHELANYGSYVVWGLWVSGYIYFIGLSAGAFLLSSLIYVFASKELEAIGKLSLFVAVITLLMALISIWFDLGHMERFYYIFTRPNFQSMMAWMVWLYTGYFLLLLAENWFAFRPDFVRWANEETGWRRAVAKVVLFGRTTEKAGSAALNRKTLRILGSVGIPLAIAFHGGVGALFGTVLARPYWNTPLYPIMFLTGALVSGGALMTATVAFFWPKDHASFIPILRRLGRIVLVLLVFDVLLEWAEFSIPMWYGIGQETELLRQVLFGPYWWVVWVLHIGLGVVVPLILLSEKPKNAKAVGSACALIAVTFMAVRLNIVVPGLVTPELEGLQHAFVDQRLVFSYVPSAFEWAVMSFIVSLGLALFLLGYKYLPVSGVREVRP